MLQFIQGKKKFFLILAAVIAIGTGVFFYLHNQNGKQIKYQEFEVKKINLVRSIEATGSLQPATSVDISFKKSGLIENVFVDVGDRVERGKILAELENNKELAALEQNKAFLAEANANLNLQLADATKEDILIAQADIKQAIANKEKAEVNLNNSLIELENAKKTIAQDILTAELEVENARLNFEKAQLDTSSSSIENDSQVQNTAIAYKSAIGNLLIGAKTHFQAIDRLFGVEGVSIFFGKVNYYLDVNSEDYFQAKTRYVQNLNDFKEMQALYNGLPQDLNIDELKALFLPFDSFIKNVQQGQLLATFVVDWLISSVDLTEAEIQQLRNEITSTGTSFNTNVTAYNTARKNFEDAIIDQNSSGDTKILDVKSAELAILQKEQNLEKTKINGDVLISNRETSVKALEADVVIQNALINKANAHLEKILAKPREVEVAPYRSRVLQAKAQVLNAENDLEDTILRAPFTGIITSKNIEIGQQFVAGTVSYGIIDDSKFHIDVSIPETEINRINLENKVQVRFDAVGTDEEFEAKILSFEPAADNLDETIYYKAKIVLLENDPRLKSDMTADVMITSLTSDPILVIPEKAVFLENNVKKVRVKSDKIQPEVVEIKTGLRGDDGLIEVLSGLESGQIVLYE